MEVNRMGSIVRGLNLAREPEERNNNTGSDITCNVEDSPPAIAKVGDKDLTASEFKLNRLNSESQVDTPTEQKETKAMSFEDQLERYRHLATMQLPESSYSLPNLEYESEVDLNLDNQRNTKAGMKFTEEIVEDSNNIQIEEHTDNVVASEVDSESESTNLEESTEHKGDATPEVNMSSSEEVSILAKQVADLTAALAAVELKLKETEARNIKDNEHEDSSIQEEPTQEEPVQEEPAQKEPVQEESVQEDKGYFPFRYAIKKEFPAIMDNLTRLQNIYDYDKQESIVRRKSRFSRTLGALKDIGRDGTEDESEHIAAVQAALEFKTPEQVSSYIREICFDLGDEEGRNEVIEREFGPPSALFGVYILHNIEDRSGCSSVDIYTSKHDAKGNFIVEFEIFPKIFCGFDNHEDANRFCEFMKEYIPCSIAEVRVNEKGESIKYEPFKKNLKSYAILCLNRNQVYQAYEDYQECPHGIRGIIAMANDIKESKQNLEYNDMYSTRAYKNYGRSPYGSDRFGGYTNPTYSYNRYRNYNQDSRYSYDKGYNSGTGLSKVGSFAKGMLRNTANIVGGVFIGAARVTGMANRAYHGVRQYMNDNTSRGIENLLINCKSFKKLMFMIEELDNRVPKKIRRKTLKGEFSTDYHVCGLGSVAAYKVLQLSLDTSSGVDEVLVGQQNEGSHGSNTVTFADFGDLYCTFKSHDDAEKFAQYMSDYLSVYFE